MDKVTKMKSSLQEIAEPIPAKALAEDISKMGGSGPLVTQGPFDVYLAPAGAIPNVLLEIGRLREVTFRSVGEGTGKSRDLDHRDEFYSHLFLWDLSLIHI